MKTKNFPAKKLLRQLRAQGKDVNAPENQQLIQQARDKRTKKRRN